MTFDRILFLLFIFLLQYRAPYLCCGRDDDFIRDRYILIRSVGTHISIRVIFVFVTSVTPSSRATAPAEM